MPRTYQSRIRLEKDLQKKFVEILKEDDPNRIVVKLAMFGGYGETGWPDLLILENNHKGPEAWFIEVKMPRGIVSRRQDRALKKLRSLGFKAHVVRTVNELECLLNL